VERPLFILGIQPYLVKYAFCLPFAETSVVSPGSCGGAEVFQSSQGMQRFVSHVEILRRWIWKHIRTLKRLRFS